MTTQVSDYARRQHLSQMRSRYATDADYQMKKREAARQWYEQNKAHYMELQRERRAKKRAQRLAEMEVEFA